MLRWKSGLKIIKLGLDTSLKAQASDWLKCKQVSISANQVLEIGDWCFIILGPGLEKFTDLISVCLVIFNIILKVKTKRL